MSYTMNYDPERTQFVAVEWSKSNIYGFDEHIQTLEYARRYAEECNYILTKGGAEVIQCKDCGRYYVLFNSEKDWFVNRELHIPKRCPTCRRARRIRNVG